MPANPNVPSGPSRGNTGGGSSANRPGLTFPTTGSIGNGLGQNASVDTAPILNPLKQPPSMKTLVYSPDVRVLIAHGGKQYDVSDDIVRCALQRQEGAVASFSMTLSNKGLRYTPTSGIPKFSRMDRIVVYMKRTTFVQVFSGYLDTVPYKQLYPGTVNFSASCTLKRLLYTWWNPGLPDSSPLITSPVETSTAGDGQLPKDAGMGSMLRRILVLVGGWDMGNIHIQNFPTTFFEFLKKQAAKNQPEYDAAAEKFKHLLLGDDISPGPKGAASHNTSAGPPGPYTPAGGIGNSVASSATSGNTEFYVDEIVLATDQRAMGPLVSDNNVAAGLAQAGVTGQNSLSASQGKAWQQVQQTNLDAQQANRKSDAAIIATAVALVESGGGTSIHNYSSPAAPGSSAWGEGPTPFAPDHSSCGIMQQQNFAEWGDVSQRMNPRQAAGMFLDHLSSMVPNWRNTDPGAAAQTVQRSGFPAKYGKAIPLATQLVAASRTKATGPLTSAAASAATGTTTTGAINAPSGSGGAPSTNPNLVPGAPTISPQAVTGGVSLGAAAGAKPTPDSEGAVQFMLSKVGKFPYVWGGKGPSGYDCSGLVSAAFASIGINVPSQTNSIRASIQQIPKSMAGRGDIYEPESGHVTVLLGPPGTTHVHASTSNAPLSGDPSKTQIRVNNWYAGSSEWYGRPTGLSNGGPDPTSPYNFSATADGGVPSTGVDTQAGVTGTGSGGTSEPIARNLFSYVFQPGSYAPDVGLLYGGEKVFLDGEPLIQVVKAITGASLRQFQSAPNGDFMAYYPDWWGLDGKPCVYRLEDIELKDVRIDLTDHALTTHVYINGDLSLIGQPDQVLGWLTTAGVATVEDDWLYQRLIKVAPGDPDNLDGQALMRRYGIRPLKQTYSMAGSHELELILAIQTFMQKWAEQYQTQISTTFMPELYPGMRIELAGHNLSVYVAAVSHSCDFEGGFSTNATIMAPANPNALSDIGKTRTKSGPGMDIKTGFDDGQGHGFGDSTNGDPDIILGAVAGK